MKPLLIGLLFFSHLAVAKPLYLNQLQSEVNQRVPGTALPYRCQSCHASKGSPAALNPFGHDFKQIVRMGAFATDVESWEALFSADSDGDGRSNLEEFAAGENPGILQ